MWETLTIWLMVLQDTLFRWVNLFLIISSFISKFCYIDWLKLSCMNKNRCIQNHGLQYWCLWTIRACGIWGLQYGKIDIWDKSCIWGFGAMNKAYTLRLISLRMHCFVARLNICLNFKHYLRDIQFDYWHDYVCNMIFYFLRLFCLEISVTRVWLSCKNEKEKGCVCFSNESLIDLIFY